MQEPTHIRTFNTILVLATGEVLKFDSINRAKHKSRISGALGVKDRWIVRRAK